VKLTQFALSNVNKRLRARLFTLSAAILLITAVIDTAGIVSLNPNSPIEGDGAQYLHLAQALATNRGYHLDISPWPNQPAVGRLPLWPALLSLPLRALPQANPDAVAKYTGAVLHGISSAFLVVLTFQLTGSLKAAAGGGGILACYAPAAGLVIGGYSEVTFVATMLLALILLFEGGLWQYIGALSAGAAVLARSNYLLLPLLLILLLALRRRESLLTSHGARVALMAILCFSLLPCLWVVRNWRVTGHFPLLSATEGETLYGGNNVLVGSDLNLWGYWIAPDALPGEATKIQLARQKSEAEVNSHYHSEGMRYIRDHWHFLPRLILGKLVRGFVPVPWSPATAVALVAFFRFCLYGAFLSFFNAWRPRNAGYDFLLASMFLVTIVTTVVYYGSARMTFCFEPFLIPFIVGGILTKKRARVMGTTVRHERKRAEEGPMGVTA
jgi:hypothetical protein